MKSFLFVVGLLKFESRLGLHAEFAVSFRTVSVSEYLIIRPISQDIHSKHCAANLVGLCCICC